MKDVQLLIIGNQFSALTNKVNILNCDQFNDFINQLPDEQNKLQIHLGQGLSDLEIDSIRQQIKQSTFKDQLFLSGLVSHAKRAVNQSTQGSIISEPEKISDCLFRSVLMLDPSCAEMNVNASGCHIPSMVFVEAARQMVAVVSDKFLLVDEACKNKTLVVNQIHTSFYECIFPLDVVLLFKIETFREGLYGNFQAEAVIEVVQNEKTMMSVTIDFSQMDKNTLLDIEKEMACSAVEQLLKTPLGLVNQIAA